MAAILLQVADAVVSELNSQVWSQTFTAVRQNVPRIARESATNLSVIVTPTSRETAQFSRSAVSGLHKISVGIQKGLTGDTNAETDALVTLGEELAEYFDDGRKLATLSSAVCVQTEFGAGAESQWLSLQDQERFLLYTGVVVLTFRVFR
jgi:hypothetical protein